MLPCKTLFLEVKEVANVVTPMTNDEEAVAWAIEEYVQRRIRIWGLFDRLFGKKKNLKSEEGCKRSSGKSWLSEDTEAGKFLKKR